MSIYNDRMYFGNRNRMVWIKAPQVDYEAGRRGWSNVNNYLNGGTFVRRSSTGSKGYVFSWTKKPRDEVRKVTDYTDGVYGSGPLYFLEPFAMDKNVLPQYWATPVLAAGDAPLLIGEYDADRPDKLTTPVNGLDYPYESAVYTLDGLKRVTQLWVPVPPGYNLWFGVHGKATGTAAVQIYPTTGPTTVGTPQNITLLKETDQTRVNTQVDGNAYTGAIITFTGIGTLTLYGLMAQIFPSAVTPPGGNFISGQGHSGCSVAEEPTLSNYSAAIDLVGASINLVETEGWQ